MTKFLVLENLKQRPAESPCAFDSLCRLSKSRVLNMWSFGNHAYIQMSWPVFMMIHQSRSAEVLFVIVKNTLQSGHSEQPEKDRK